MLPRDEKEEEKLTGRLILLISGDQNYNPLNSASSEEDTNSRFIWERWQRRHPPLEKSCSRRRRKWQAWVPDHFKVLNIWEPVRICRQKPRMVLDTHLAQTQPYNPPGKTAADLFLPLKGGGKTISPPRDPKWEEEKSLLFLLLLRCQLCQLSQWSIS